MRSSYDLKATDDDLEVEFRELLSDLGFYLLENSQLFLQGNCLLVVAKEASEDVSELHDGY